MEPDARQQLCTIGICRPLISLLRQSDDDRLAEVIIGTLGNLALFNGDVRVALPALGIIDLLLRRCAHSRNDLMLEMSSKLFYLAFHF